MVTAVTTTTGQLPPATVYQVVYDISALGGAENKPGQENVISIELGESVCVVLAVKLRREQWAEFQI